MKNIIASAAIIFSSLVVSATVRADCTNNPFRLGWDAANQACDEIATGYMPEAYPGYGLGGYESTAEKTCSPSDVIRCKNAMAQYLRSGEGRSCARLIERDQPIENAPGKTARTVWRNYMATTCNQ